MSDKKERPIIFSPIMIDALISGRKTQTRRICTGVRNDNSVVLKKPTKTRMGITSHIMDAPSPYGKAGDSLWVRENFSVHNLDRGYQNPDVWDDFRPPSCKVRFADGVEVDRELIDDPSEGFDDYAQAVRAANKKTVPSIHMPRWASRIDLLIANVRVERLQSISEKDAKAEGTPENMTFVPVQVDKKTMSALKDDGRHTAFIERMANPPVMQDWREGFRRLWESINGKESWDANPWVWVIDFTVQK